MSDYKTHLLISGASGYVGRNLIERLSNNSLVRVYALVRKYSPDLEFENTIQIEADLSSDSFVYKLPSRVDHVFHLVQSNNYRLFPDQANDVFDVNVRSTMLLLDWSRVVGVKKFVFASTGNVYSSSKEKVDENHLCAPESFYGASKRIAELLIQQYREYMYCYILRVYSVYGPGQENKLVPGLIKRVLNHDDIVIDGDDGLITTPLFIDDLCKVFIRIMDDKPSDSLCVWNVSGTEELSLRQIVEQIAKETGVQTKILSNDKLPLVMSADNSKIKKDLLFTFTSFEKGLKKTLEG